MCVNILNYSLRGEFLVYSVVWTFYKHGNDVHLLLAAGYIVDGLLMPKLCAGD